MNMSADKAKPIAIACVRSSAIVASIVAVKASIALLNRRPKMPRMPTQSLMRQAVTATGWIVIQEPITSAGRIDGQPFSFPGARHPDIGAILPGLALKADLDIVDCWAEAPAGAGPGPIADYLTDLTGVSPEDSSVVLPPLVTLVARRRQIRSL